MEKELYTWEQLRAYSIIALHSLLHSANEINLKNMKMFIDPLQTLYSKAEVIEFANYLVNKEENEN